MEATTLKVETKHLTLVPISQILLGTRVSFVKISLHIIQWLSTQSYQEQYKFGIERLKKLGWKP